MFLIWFAVLHGKESFVIAMDIIMERVRYGALNRVFSNQRHGQLDLLVNYNCHFSIFGQEKLLKIRFQTDLLS
jgi:hypothetical protein